MEVLKYISDFNKIAFLFSFVKFQYFMINLIVEC